MSWILIAIIAYFFLALVNIGDKLFLGNFIPNYKAYSALIGIFSIIILVLGPWYLSWPGGTVFIVSLISGALFIGALLAFFYSLQVGEASRVIPFVGGLVPIFSLVFSLVFLGDTFSGRELMAFMLLIIGTTLIVRLPHNTHWWEKIWDKIHPPHHAREVVIAVLAAMLFAASFVGSKFVYDSAGFLNGFMWLRLGGVLAALAILANSDNRRAFQAAVKRIMSKTGLLFVGNQSFGAVGFFLQGYAISLGSVALVNAMQGVQYVFVILLAVLASIKFPKLSGEEKIDAKIIIEKVAAVLIVGAGLAVLAL